MFYNLRLLYTNLLRKGILNMENAQRVRIESRGYEVENILSFLKSEIKELTLLASNNQASNKLKSLTEENEILRKEITLVKEELANLQLVNGIIQVSLPTDDIEIFADLVQPQSIIDNTHIKNDDGKHKKTVQENKEKIAKSEKDVKDPEEPPVDVGRLDFRVGRIVDAKKHPDADSLYVEQIDLGEEKPRTVVSGLVKFVPLDDLQNRSVVVLCNLKPMRMRGILSEAMVMCASTSDAVEPLTPPKGSIPGNVITVEGYARNPDPLLNPRKKVFETVAPDLKTNTEGIATYKGVEWKVGDKGVVRAKTLFGAPIK